MTLEKKNKKKGKKNSGRRRLILRYHYISIECKETEEENQSDKEWLDHVLDNIAFDIEEVLETQSKSN